MKNPRQKTPTERDLLIWRTAQHDLIDFQYKGLSGYFQIAGHRRIHRLAGYLGDNFTIEIGCGHGHHLQYIKNGYRCYVGLDQSYSFLSTLRQRFPNTMVTNGDVYYLPFKSHSVQRVVAVYCLEHFRRLDDCLKEVRRILKPGGEFLAALPAEGGFVYGLGRWFTSKRYMEKKYGINYDSIVKWEHCNSCQEVINLVDKRFRIKKLKYLPFLVPSIHMNVIILIKAVHDGERS